MDEWVILGSLLVYEDEDPYWEKDNIYLIESVRYS